MPEVNPTEIGSPPPAGGGEGAPSGTPSGDAIDPKGEREIGRANVMVALSHLEKQLPLLGSDSEEGKAVLAAINALSKKFSGQKSEDLAPAELIQLMGSQPDAVKQQMMKEMAGPGNLGGPGPAATGIKFAPQ